MTGEDSNAHEVQVVNTKDDWGSLDWDGECTVRLGGGTPRSKGAGDEGCGHDGGSEPNAGHGPRGDRTRQEASKRSVLR